MVNQVRREAFQDWVYLVKSGQLPGVYGQVQYSEDGESIICPLCGQEFKMLHHRHLKSHGLTCADDLREIMGLNRTQPLSSLAHKQRIRDHAFNNNSAARIINLKATNVAFLNLNYCT